MLFIAGYQAAYSGVKGRKSIYTGLIEVTTDTPPTVEAFLRATNFSQASVGLIDTTMTTDVRSV